KEFAGEDFLLLGEIFHTNPDYIDRYDHLGFTSIIDFPLNQSLVHAVAGSGSMLDVSRQIEENRYYYDTGVLPALFLDNHDLPRFAYLVNEFGKQEELSDRIKLGLTFINTYTGLPILYYGTEYGAPGGRYDDYLNRQFMDWETLAKEEQNPF